MHIPNLMSFFTDRWTASAKPMERRKRLETNAEPSLVYAIGDVHGCLSKLRELEALIIEDARAFEGPRLMVMLGDYVDRGPQSAGVIDHLLADAPPGFERICLCGNHEDIMLRSLEDQSYDVADWLECGGISTLLSYGYDVDHLARTMRINQKEAARRCLARLPSRHVSFLRALPVAFATPSFLFVHAGVRRGVDLADQSDHDLLWTRVHGPDTTLLPGRRVVHGHTPTSRPIVTAHRIAIDTGAYRGGRLTAVRLQEGDVRFLQTG